MQHGRSRDRWIYDLCGNPRPKSKKASTVAQHLGELRSEGAPVESITPAGKIVD
jgi:hypothetical protein